MLIKIGDKLFDSKDENILIVLQDGDLESLYKLKGNNYRLCISTKEISEEELKELMRLDIDPNHGA